MKQPLSVRSRSRSASVSLLGNLGLEFDAVEEGAVVGRLVGRLVLVGEVVVVVEDAEGVWGWCEAVGAVGIRVAGDMVVVVWRGARGRSGLAGGSYLL